MNTVGKEGRLGGDIRCVVSVSMLTEGWDANTVTHVLGVRAFGTQLLCEQVIGRALRRQSYDLNEEGLFNVEYADVLGIPFDFAAKPVVVVAAPPRQTIQVKAVRPDRDALEISFPRVMGYRVELPNERLTAKFTDDSKLFLTPELDRRHRRRRMRASSAKASTSRSSTSARHPALHRPLSAHHAPALHQVARSRRRGAAASLRPAQAHRQGVARYLPYLSRRHLPGADSLSAPCGHGLRAHHRRHQYRRGRIADRARSRLLLDPFNPVGSTSHVNFTTSKTSRWQTDSRRCQINWVIFDSDWEAEFCRVAENHPRVRSYVKNHNLGFDVPYRYGSESRIYRPDFIVLIEDGHGEDDLLHLVVEVKGYRREDAKDKKLTMENYWVPGVNNTGKFGRWAFVEFTEVFGMNADFAARIESEFEKMVESVDCQPEPQQK